MKILFALVLSFISLQDTGWIRGNCEKCRVFANLDYPSNGSILNQNFYLAGWGFECQSGATADRFNVYVKRSTEQFYQAHTVNAVYFTLHRPDVKSAFIGYCPNVTSNSGFHVYTNLAPGEWDVVLNVWKEPYYESFYRRIIIQ